MNTAFRDSLFPASVLLLSGLASTALSATIRVPEDYTVVEEAVAAASDGDTVLVADGTYVVSGQIEVRKPITLKSVNGSASTVLTVNFTPPAKPSASEVYRCILIDDPGAVVDGFTFSGGYLYDGGSSSDPLARFGSGVYLNAGSLLNSRITNCTLGKAKVGGALAMMGTSAFASNCLVTANTTLSGAYGYEVHGVGVYAVAGEIVDSEISDNTYLGNTYPRGAGVHVADSGDNSVSFKMRRCRILRNTCPTAQYVGYWGTPGGLYCVGRNPLYENLLIADNSTAGNGGGVWLGFSNYTPKQFVNCTIAGNTAAYGGGIDDYTGYGRFYNCIIQGNTVTGGDTTEWKPESRGKSRFYNSLSPVDYVTKANCSGCIQGTATFKAGGYELAAGSLGYNQGAVGTFAWLESALDLNGNPRIWEGDGEGIIDIGCYEYSAAGLDVSIASESADPYVMRGNSLSFTGNVLPAGTDYTCSWTVDGQSAGTGSSLEYQFNALGIHIVGLTVTAGGADYEAEPLSVSVYPETLYVVNPQGNQTHIPESPCATPEAAATSIADAVEAAGSGSRIYVGEGEYLVDSEILVEKGVAILASADRSRTLVRRSAGKTRLLNLNHPDAVVSGITFKDGFHDVSGYYGGGVLIRGNGGTLTNCTVTSCTLSSVQQHYGAGVYMQNGLLVDCDITDNTNSVNDASYRHGYGGGVYISAGEMRNCRVMRNAMLVNTERGNHMQPGGAIYAEGGVITGCLIADNACYGDGGGIYFNNYAAVSNCTFAGNSAYRGAGIAAGSVFAVCNTAIAENSSQDGGQLSLNTLSPDVTYSFGPAGDLPAGAGNVFGTDAGFLDAARSKYRPRQGSPLVRRAVYADWMATAKDLDGRPRASAARKVDIGCYQTGNAGLSVFIK